MKVMSFNVNGLRSRLHQMEAVFELHAPDIIGLQETKVHDPEFPLEPLQNAGYHVEFFGQKGHYGVALLSRMAPLSVSKGFIGEPEDAQRRLITCSYPLPSGGQLHVANGYFPNGESRNHPTKFPCKRDFYADLMTKLKSEFTPEDHLIILGDFNVAPGDGDIGIGEQAAKRWLRQGVCSFLPEEREWLATLMDWGLIDTYRQHHPEVDDRFSWFDYRSRAFEREPRRGLRIDFLLASEPVAKKCREAGIDYDMRGMVKPSDHAPVWAVFDL